MYKRQGKYLRSCNEYVDTNTPDLDGSIRAAIRKLQEQGAQTFVAAEAFSVDDPKNCLLYTSRCV